MRQDDRATDPGGENTNRPGFIVAVSLLCLLLGGVDGWLLRPPGEPTAVSGGPGSTTRLEGYAFVRPLLECDISADADSLRFEALHGALSEAVERAISGGAVTHVSVYLRDLNSTRVLGIHEDEGFSPASLLKVPVMMMVLRAAERDATLLDRPIVFDLPGSETLPQNIAPERVLERGRSYSLWTLVEHMIVESDNLAMEAVGSQFKPGEYLQTFADLGLVPPQLNGQDPLMSVEQYASFFRILYNAAYLGPDMRRRRSRCSPRSASTGASWRVSRAT